MKGIFKSCISSLLILTILLIFSAGCNKDSDMEKENTQIETTQPTVDQNSETISDENELPKLPLKEPVKLTVLNIERPGYNTDNIIAKEIEKRTGIILDYTWLAAQDFATKQPLLLASGDFQDIMVINSASGKSASSISWEFGEEGIFAKLNDYIDKMPNVKRFSEIIPNYKAVVEDTKGNFYALPQASTVMGKYDVKFIYQSWLMNEDIFNNHGIKEPKTTDELLEVLKQLKKEYPQSYPLSSAGTYDVLVPLGLTYGTDGNIDYNGGVYWNPDENVYKCPALEDTYRTMIEFVHNLYSEELLDPEFATNSRDQLVDKLANKKTFITHNWIPEIFGMGEKIITQYPEFSLKSIDPLNHDGRQGKYLSYGGEVSDWWLMVFNAKSKHLKEALAFVNYMHSQECIDFISWGIEGETYETKDGLKHFLPNVKTKMNPNGTVDIKDYLSETNAALGVQPVVEFFSSIEMGWDKKSTDTMYYFVENSDKFAVKHPNFKIIFSKEEDEEKNKISVPLSTYISETTIRFIMGDIPLNDTEWEKFTEKVKDMGAEKLVTMYNEKIKTAKKW